MTTIFTNGCFDIIHYGHIKLFEYAKSLGDRLIVGLNSDNSVRKLKGSLRPINSEFSRAEILKSIKYIDEVVVFDEETPLNLINQIKPDIIVKGGDYSVSDVVGNKVAEVKIFKFIDGYSTTKLIKDIGVR